MSLKNRAGPAGRARRGLRGNRGRGAAPDPCNRACLKDLANSYLAALVAHDPSKVPLAADVKFVENVTPMKPGEGLWKTASEAPTTFAIYVPDPVSEQVGFIGMMKADGKPIELALRLKVRHGRDRRGRTPDCRATCATTCSPTCSTPRPGCWRWCPRTSAARTRSCSRSARPTTRHWSRVMAHCHRLRMTANATKTA